MAACEPFDPGNRSGALVWIWICGPFASDGANEAARRANLRALNLAAYEVFQLAHVPLIGANMALPVIQAAGLDERGYEIRRPLSLALMQKCDACLRIGGASKGADEETAWFSSQGLPAFFSLEEIPRGAESGAPLNSPAA